MRTAFILLIALLSATCSFGQIRQAPDGPPPPNLTPAQVHSVVDSLCSRVKQIYIFPDTAAKMAQYVQDQYKKGVYADYRNPIQLARRLEKDLQTAHHDGHLHVMYLLQPPAGPVDTTGAAKRQKDDDARRLAEMRANNFAFVRTEVLPGNIGYVRFDGFVGDLDAAAPTVTSAFRFVSHTSALLIDMRFNHGGSPWMVGRVESYFFAVRTHMNDLVERQAPTMEVWTDPAKADSLILTMPVYILTSRSTFSGGEDFTYSMQSIHRAVVVGDTTGGGAHPTGGFDLGLGFVAGIPSGRALNPYTHTDWEGTGVRPDVPVASEKALETAEMHFFTQRLQQAGTNEERNRAEWQLNNLKASQITIRPDSSTLSAYAGVYQGGLDFYIRGGDLYCRNPERGGEVFRLKYFAPDQFVLDENVELEFTRNAAGKVEGFRMHWSHGGISYKARNM